jgi:hypothetical protein
LKEEEEGRVDFGIGKRRVYPISKIRTFFSTSNGDKRIPPGLWLVSNRLLKSGEGAALRWAGLQVQRYTEGLLGGSRGPG